MKGVLVFLEMIPFFGMAGLLVLQVSVWIFAVKRLIDDVADVEDVLLLIPGAFFVGGIWIVLKRIPSAILRKP